MSLNRLVFYSAMSGGWAAFAGWLLAELFLFRRTDLQGCSTLLVIVINLLTTGLVGAFIAGGLNLLGGVASGTFKGQLHRLLPGLLGGFFGGAIGSTIGNAIYMVLPNPLVRTFGWTLMGLGIGAVEGVYDRSPKKLRNGMIGGAIGGFLGGFLFDPIAELVAGGMSGRAVAFVILGMCIGLFIGLAQVILKEAWLTVEEGFRPGRQLVLSLAETALGTSEKAQLPFIAFGAKGVEPIHLRILRQDSGVFILQDNHSRTGTFVNGVRVDGMVVLKNNDAIQLGPNHVRFREVHRHVSSGVPQIATATASAGPAPSAPVPGPVMATAIPANPPPPPRPAPAPVSRGAVQPVAPVPASPSRVKTAPTPAPAKVPPPAPGPAGNAPKGCPICGRPGIAVPQSAKRKCASCGIQF